MNSFRCLLLAFALSLFISSFGFEVEASKHNKHEQKKHHKVERHLVENKNSPFSKTVLGHVVCGQCMGGTPLPGMVVMIECKNINGEVSFKAARTTDGNGAFMVDLPRNQREKMSTCSATIVSIDFETRQEILVSGKQSVYTFGDLDYSRRESWSLLAPRRSLKQVGGGGGAGGGFGGGNGGGGGGANNGGGFGGGNGGAGGGFGGGNGGANGGGFGGGNGGAGGGGNGGANGGGFGGGANNGGGFGGGANNGGGFGGGANNGGGFGGGGNGRGFLPFGGQPATVPAPAPAPGS